MSQATGRCPICQETSAHIRQPGAKIERHGPPAVSHGRTDDAEPICPRCGVSREGLVGVIAEAPTPRFSRLHDLVAIARPDHWIKNVFVLPGAFVAWTMDPAVSGEQLPLRLLVGLGSTCLVASSNYVINEILDAPSDRYHPTKQHRPLAAGRLDPGSAYILWLLLMVAGLALSFVVSRHFVVTLAALWLMGCVYNIPPLRTKDVAHLDVLSEAVNNPLRMLAGWYIVSHAIPPASLLLSYWMVGCYFMAVKRFAESRELADGLRAASYRRSFAYYTPERLLVAIMFYTSASMLFFGAFIMRYKFELILSFPFIALVMAVYLRLAFKANSPAQHPEKLYRESLLVASILVCTVLMIALLAVDLPGLQAIFAPTVPTAEFETLQTGP